MFELTGKYASAKVFTDIIESEAISQILSMLNQKFVEGQKIRIMPDVHAGAGCTIGTTMTIKDKIVPNLVGVDIGCGMETVMLEEKEIDFCILDDVIRTRIPSGFDIRDDTHEYYRHISEDLHRLKCKENVDLHRAEYSLGTLGGGNHFCEVDRDQYGNLALVIHSGSRHLGKQVALYYQNLAYKQLNDRRDEIKQIIDTLKCAGRKTEIESVIKQYKAEHACSIPKDLAYLEGELFDDYIHDMKIVQRYASLNRKAIAHTILSEMGLTSTYEFTTIHNYIDTDSMILRKGAVSAKQDELLLIPINMRDGSLLCYGLGNEDWNCSAPHGAGRLMSRSRAKESFTVEEYERQMDGIFTSSVCYGTLDECPMAYKSIEDIVKNISETVQIVDRLKPVYNFKAS